MLVGHHSCRQHLLQAECEREAELGTAQNICHSLGSQIVAAGGAQVQDLIGVYVYAEPTCEARPDSLQADHYHHNMDRYGISKVVDKVDVNRTVEIVGEVFVAECGVAVAVAD